VSKGKILLVAQRPSDYVEMRRGADALHLCDYTIQIMYHPCEGPNSASEALVLQDGKQAEQDEKLERFEIFDFFHIMEKTPSKKSRDRKSRLGPRFVKYIVLIHEILGGIVNIVRYTRMCRIYEKKIKGINPDLIILPEDVVGIVSPQIIKAAHRLGIPSLILPYTIANQEEAFRSLSAQPAYQRTHPANWVISLLYPRWVMERDGISLVRLPGPHLLGHEFTGTTPPDPWMMNSGFANAIAVENRAMLDYYRDAGLPDSKLRLVGAVYDDYLAKYRLNKEAELANLRQELGLAEGKPVLTIVGCPDQSSGHHPGGFEYEDMADMCKHIAEALQPLKVHYEIVVRPHPNFLKMGDLLEEAGFRKTTVDTARLIALSDAIVAFASATIRWAIACGVPVVNYDVFQFNYDDYKGFEGVVHANSLKEFDDALRRLVPHQEDFALLKRKQAEICEDWGRLDGRSVERIVGLIEELRSEKPVSRRSA
jgi:hypothetical protein